MESIMVGIYKHYKGKFYEVIGECVHSETLEEMVLYKSLSGDEEFPAGTLWARPRVMFEENILVDEEMVKRFEFQEET